MNSILHPLRNSMIFFYAIQIFFSTLLPAQRAGYLLVCYEYIAGDHSCPIYMDHPLVLPYNLSSTAMKKMMAGIELSAADATVAEVNLRLILYRFTPSVILKKQFRSTRRSILLGTALSSCFSLQITIAPIGSFFCLICRN